MEGLTILGQAYYEAVAERQEARDQAAIASMLGAFADDDSGKAANLVEPPAGVDPPGTAVEQAPEAPQAATEAVPQGGEVASTPKKKGRPKAPEPILPYLPADEPVFGSTELSTGLVIRMLDGMAVNIMTKVLGDPVSLGTRHATFGAKERISVRTDIDGRGCWKDTLANLEGNHFHDLLAHLLNVDPDRAITIGHALANDIDVEKARLAMERKVGKGQEAGFLSIWEAATPLRQSLALKPLRVAQGLDVRFSACGFDNLRGDNEGRLLALHRDPQSGSAVGLTVFSPRGEAVEAHGDAMAPVPFADWEDRSRIIIAPTMKVALFVAAFESPVIWIPRLFDRTSWPKFPAGKNFLVPLNSPTTGEIGMLKARHGLHGREDLRILLPQSDQRFPQHDK